MRLTEEEKAICKKYGARDADGKVHCYECPLRIHPEWGYQSYGWCKSTCIAIEWHEWLEHLEQMKFKRESMRLINADELIKYIPTEEYIARCIVANAPTVDAIPIEYMRSQVDCGKWEEIIQRWKEHERSHTNI